MAVTPSAMIPLGTQAPAFRLLDPKSNTFVKLEDSQGAVATVILFISNHCPYVLHIEQGIIDLAKQYLGKGIGFIAIGANNVETHPADGPEKIAEHRYPFPYLYDETQEVAKAYDAACTPDIFVFDDGMKCVYRGQFDSARPGNDAPVNGEDLKAALDSLIAGDVVSPEQTPSIGCNIKWK